MGDPHAEVEIKPQLKPRGSVAEEENLEPAHQLHKLQIKSIRSTRLTLRSLRAPTKENTLARIAVDIGGKNTQEQDQIRI